VVLNCQERKRNTKIRKLFKLEPVSTVKIGKLRWFGLVHKNDANWVKCDRTMKADGTRQRNCPRKTCWDCVKEDMKSLACPKSRNN